MLAGRPGARIVADEERLPFRDAGADLIVSSLALHWVNDLVGTLIQIRRALEARRAVPGAILGGATLTELRGSLLEAEAELAAAPARASRPSPTPATRPACCSAPASPCRWPTSTG